MSRGFSVAVLCVAPALLAGCTSVDTTEHCVLTRYGTVVEQRMGSGLHFTPFTSATCFKMVDHNFPSSQDGKETVSAQTSDPVTVEGDVNVVYAYDPATVYQVFLEKRNPEQAEQEILNAVREGYRDAIAGWTVAKIYSAQRAFLSDSVRVAIQRKIGQKAIIKQVYIRDIRAPQAIEEARIAAARQAQILDQQEKQYIIDSVKARSVIIAAEANAKQQQLLADAYKANPQLLQLKIAEAQADGLAHACEHSQTCVIGGSILDTWKAVGK